MKNGLQPWGLLRGSVQKRRLFSPRTRGRGVRSPPSPTGWDQAPGRGRPGGKMKRVERKPRFELAGAPSLVAAFVWLVPSGAWGLGLRPPRKKLRSWRL